MTRLSELTALRDRVIAATGADRVIDRAIAKYFKIGWDYGADWPTIIDDDGEKTSEPTAYPYTASVDAALALCERLLPGAMWSVCEMEDGPFAQVLRPMPGGDYVGGLTASTGNSAPLAILAAILNALIAKETSDAE